MVHDFFAYYVYTNSKGRNEYCRARIVVSATHAEDAEAIAVATFRDRFISDARLLRLEPCQAGRGIVVGVAKPCLKREVFEGNGDKFTVYNVRGRE
jgi:hypothetical protein